MLSSTVATSSATAFVPLTTVFIPPEACTNHLATVPTTWSGTTTFYNHFGDFNHSTCMPSGWNPSSYFSPGRCPSGYTVASSVVSITNDSTTETSGFCCPTGYTYETVTVDFVTDSPEPCHFWGSMGGDRVVHAYAVPVRWKAEDFPTASADSRRGRNALSSNAKAGIGIGITFGAFIIITFGVMILLSRQKRSQQQVQKYVSVQPYKEGQEEVEKQPFFRNESFLRSTWSLINLDSWSIEAIAVFFSTSCFVAIFCVLQIYNGKQKPQLPKGITLNAIISVLATASKSSLMFVAGECIAQLRWVSFRKYRQPLSYVQSYDSASRGPWGSLTILLKDKCRSLVTLGALIVLLAMAFDPFIQQIIEYPVLPTQHQSKAAQVLQSRYFLPPGSGNKDFLDALNGGIWYDSIEPNVSCPTGNCTWPSFRSVEMCTKCVDVDPSNVTLSHGDVIPVSLGTTTPPEQGWHIPVNISILDGTPSNYSIFITDQHMNGNYKRSSMTVPRYLYWIIDGHVDSPDDSDENLIPKQRGLGDLFGIDDPLTVTASAELDFSTRFSANISALLSDHKGQSTFLSDLMGAIKVTNVTECAFSICAKEYDISVQSGDSSVKVLDEDFGSLYTASSTSFADPKLCWKPSSSPMTNWNTTGQKEWFLDRGLKTSLVMDPANFEFCGVEPQNFYEGLVALAGNMSMEYLAEYRNTTDGISDGMIDAQTDIRGGYITWVTQGQNDIQDMIASSANAQRATYVGLEMLMTNIALSVSSYARKMSSNPIYGVVTTQDSYVVVRWQWLTLPAVLLVAGTLLLIATALISSRTGVRVWKSSTLPLMFHGLESEFIARNMMIEHGQCESVSEMEHVADGTKVDLGMSTSEGRTMLRGAVPASQDVQTVVRRPSRRRSF